MEIKNQSKSKILRLKKRNKCPNCKNNAKEQFMPFCSKKCASQDLIKWLNDEYQLNIKDD
tara:strand:+ start:334 stop:513 length:180 start_codon:yes stop_codon:yes gene_type:complete